MNIVLCGMMGVGKSSVGARFAELSGRKWYDTDVYITECYGRISRLFEHYGEAFFRELETDVIRELSDKEGLVISTGGGLVLKHENIEIIKRNGKIFFLRSRFDTLLERVRVDETRPLLRMADDPEETLEKILAERTPIYEAVADYILDTDGKTVDEVAREILARVEVV